MRFFRTKLGEITLSFVGLFVFIGIVAGGDSEAPESRNVEMTQQESAVSRSAEKISKESAAHNESVAVINPRDRETQTASVQSAGVSSLESTSPQETQQTTSEADSSPEAQFYPVVRVVDGDTFSITMGGESVTVRLIGIDTPETVHPSKPVECFGDEASQKAKNVLSGNEVRVEMDESQGTYDKYGRLLAYAFLPNGTHFNKMMIEDGYAYEYTYSMPYKYQSEFKEAEREARQYERGLWALDACAEEEGEEKAENTTTSDFQGTPSKNQCSSNVYNCGDFGTHDEAQATYEYCGGVDNDVHKLDQDKDGVACESLP
ncbi:MAG: thermonuclease family protein [Candidatus Paceibacterota bacterium]